MGAFFVSTLSESRRPIPPWKAKLNILLIIRRASSSFLLCRFFHGHYCFYPDNGTSDKNHCRLLINILTNNGRKPRFINSLIVGRLQNILPKEKSANSYIYLSLSWGQCSVPTPCHFTPYSGSALIVTVITRPSMLGTFGMINRLHPGDGDEVAKLLFTTMDLVFICGITRGYG